MDCEEHHSDTVISNSENIMAPHLYSHDSLWNQSTDHGMLFVTIKHTSMIDKTYSNIILIPVSKHDPIRGAWLKQCWLGKDLPSLYGNNHDISGRAPKLFKALVKILSAAYLKDLDLIELMLPLFFMMADIDCIWKFSIFSRRRHGLFSISQYKVGLKHGQMA